MAAHRAITAHRAHHARHQDTGGGPSNAPPLALQQPPPPRVSTRFASAVARPASQPPRSAVWPLPNPPPAPASRAHLTHNACCVMCYVWMLCDDPRARCTPITARCARAPLAPTGARAGAGSPNATRQRLHDAWCRCRRSHGPRRCCWRGPAKLCGIRNRPRHAGCTVNGG
jgi:hypothetical protein